MVIARPNHCELMLTTMMMLTIVSIRTMIVVVIIIVVVVVVVVRWEEGEVGAEGVLKTRLMYQFTHLYQAST